MDTNQKDREAVRQRRPQQGSKARPAEADRRPAQPRRNAPQKNTAQRPAQRPAQGSPRRQSAAQEAPRQRRDGNIPRSAPQGTGPRKSAPQPSAQEQAAARAAARRNAPRRDTRSDPKRSPVQNLLAGVRGEKKQDPRKQEELAKRRQAKRAAAAARKRKQARRHDTPAVIYTAPQPFNMNRLFIQLLTVTAVVVALVVGMSVFFKVKTITVAGAETYSPWTVREASGIQEGDNLLTFSRARANAQLRAALPYVEKSRIGIKLPDTVIIYIEELDIAYAIKSGNGDWWLMNANGRVVELIDSSTAERYTQIYGVALESPKSGEDAVAVEDIPTETDESGEYVPVTVTGAQRLYSALQILKALEANDIVGEAASVDVSRLDDIILWYGTRYQVNLGDSSNMEYKIACMNDVILEMSEYDSGILDVSFTRWQDQVGYTPFS